MLCSCSVVSARSKESKSAFALLSSCGYLSAIISDLFFDICKAFEKSQV